VVDTSIYCIEVQLEVGYSEFVYAVTAISISGLGVGVVGRRLPPFFLQSLAPDISFLDRYGLV